MQPNRMFMFSAALAAALAITSVASAGTKINIVLAFQGAKAPAKVKTDAGKEVETRLIADGRPKAALNERILSAIGASDAKTVTIKIVVTGIDDKDDDDDADKYNTHLEVEDDDDPEADFSMDETDNDDSDDADEQEKELLGDLDKLIDGAVKYMNDNKE